MTYDRTNTGSIFTNDRKEKDTHPDSTGSANIDGKEYWINAWRKTSQNGKKFLSLSFRPKEEKPVPSAVSVPTGDDFEDDDIPF